MVMRSILTSDGKVDLISIVSAKFYYEVYIMTKEQAQLLIKNKPYDNAIYIKYRKMLIWGPCYALSEKDFEVQQDWLKKS
jgi:hypothetical protein